MATVSEADLPAVVQKLVEQAKAGEPWAIRELLDRCLGKAYCVWFRCDREMRDKLP